MTRRGITVCPEDLDFWRGLIRLAEKAAAASADKGASSLVRQAKRATSVPAPGPMASDNPFFGLGGAARRYVAAGAAERAALQGELAAASRAAATALATFEAASRPRERKDIDG